MKKSKRKDTKNRHSLFLFETKRFILKNMIKNSNFSVVIRWKAALKIAKMLKNSSTTVYGNRCILTGRRKRINALYSFSRIMFLKLVRFGYLSGLKKSSW
jgi:small subunit ribosomal protein S14